MFYRKGSLKAVFFNAEDGKPKQLKAVVCHGFTSYMCLIITSDFTVNIGALVPYICVKFRHKCVLECFLITLKDKMQVRKV